MKNIYIAPAVRAINLEAETIIATSTMRVTDKTKDTGWSNERTTSSCIWGEEG